MRPSVISRLLLSALLLLPLAAAATTEAHPGAPGGYITDWTLCGPWVSGPDMLYIDYLQAVGGEAEARLKPGMKLQRPDGEIVGCESHVAANEGHVNLGKLVNPTGESRKTRRRVGYAYSEIERAQAGRGFLAMGGEDQVAIWLNGEFVHLSLASRYYKPFQEIFPVEFAQGTNRILVKGGRRCCAWGFSLAILESETKLFVNDIDVTPAGHIGEEQYLFLPDLPVGERLDVLGSINVTNLTPRPLTGVRGSVAANAVLEATEETIASIAPGVTHQLPFRMRSKGVIGPTDSTGLELIVSVEDEIQRFHFKPRLRARGEYFATSYRSKLDGSIQAFRIIAPRQYDPERSYSLALNMHGYKAASGAHEAISSRPWLFTAAANARGEMNYKEAGMLDVLEMMEAMQKRYNIDAERIYLYGHSMGGRGSWYIGLRKPDLFAAVAPFAGRNSWALPVLENALNLPLFVLHGAKDKVVSVEHSREVVKQLEGLDYSYRYHEPAEATHWWWTDAERQQACTDDPQLYDYFSRHRLHAYPNTVVYKTEELRFNKAYWTRIDQFEWHGKAAKIRATILPGNKVDVQVENVSRYTLDLHENLLNMDAAVVILTNGTKSYSGAAGSITIGNASGTWAEASAAAALLEKHGAQAGPIFEAFNSPFILVYGSGGSAAEAKANFTQARLAQTWWQIWANGECRVVADTSLTATDIAERNLVLFGNPRSNRLIERINGHLPVRFEGNAIVAGKERFSGPEVALHMIYPNPLNPERYVLVGGGLSHRGTANLHKTGLDIAASIQFPNSAAYDYVIFDQSFLGKVEDRYLKAGHFNGNWQLQE